MKRVTRVVLALGLAASAPAVATEIDHRGVDCVVAGSFPRLEARLTPADTVGRARVFFRAEAGVHWYSVAMKPAGADFAGILPKPLESLKKLVYYIEVTDRALGTNRTAEFTPVVVAGLGACRDKAVAGALSSAVVALEAPVGAPLIPAGFASSGVASVAGTAPASATGSGAAPGAGAAGGAGAAAGTAGATAAGMAAGVKAALIIGAVGAATAAGVAVASAAGGSGDKDDCCEPIPFYTVNFLPSPPGIDVSVCAGRPLTWSAQNVNSIQGGMFDQTWAPMDPNVLRVAGSVNETSFNATLTCVSGSGSGSIQASGSGGTYQGSWSFAGKNGSVTIVARTMP